MVISEFACIISYCIKMKGGCVFSNTTLTCIIKTIGSGTEMHIGLGTKCISICLMLGVYKVYVLYVIYVICVNVDVL